jgi:predicted acyl esterase
MADPPERYTYDPLDTRAAQLENSKVNLGFWPGHYFSILAPSLAPNVLGNGLIYETAPFSEDVEISGFPKLTVWMALDTPDTDFQVVLYEVLPDEWSVALCVDRMRARYRESLKQERLVKPGEVKAYVFDRFSFVARRVSKGSRLRIALISPNSIFSEKNYNAGGVVTHESGKDARTVHVTVYHDADRPSKLDLPHLETGGASPPLGKTDRN